MPDTVKQQLKNQGYAVVKATGGPERKTYYAPDGTARLAIPSMRERQDGVIYDVLLAQGYTLTPPENPKPHCGGCGKWHNTQGEVNVCIAHKETLKKKWEKIARKEHESEEVGGLRAEVSELKEQVSKLIDALKENNG